jgi:putative transposase
MDLITLGLGSGLDDDKLLYIMVVVNKFSKKAWYVPYKKTRNGMMILQSLERELFCRLSYPSALITHRGTQITGKVWSTAIRRIGIEPSTATTAHPESNRQSERAIQTLLH